jgi:HD-like signal output (HDOD) protein
MANTISLVDRVKEFAASEKLQLPVFPRVAEEVRIIMTDDSSTSDDVAEVIGQDQALASQMLKLANSAFFAGLNRVKTIREAVLRLGLNQVLNFLVAAGQQNFYKSADPDVDKHMQVLWKHAIATAKGTRWLLNKSGYPEKADEGFLAGLLHDIGKLLLLKVVENINAENPNKRLSESFIAEIMDAMHVEQGFGLMNAWSIPDVYCNVVRDHHTEDFDPGDVLLMAVRTVNQVCKKAGLSTRPDPNLIPATLPEAHALNVKEIYLAELEIVIEDALEVQG